MKGTTIGAALVIAAALAGTASAGGRGEHGRFGWAGPGRGGAMLDFEAVAAPGTEALDRGALVTWGTERLAALDTDGNGSLNRQELAAVLPQMPENRLMVFAPDPTEMRIDRFLSAFDAEAAGEVAVETVVARQVDGLFRRLDRNDDGSISRAEAEATPDERGRRWRD